MTTLRSTWFVSYGRAKGDSVTITPQELIRHGEAIQRLMTDKSVQSVFEALEQRMFMEWKATTDPAERELVWAKVSALGDLKRALEATVVVGQDAALRLEMEERKPGRQH